jgi:hypothetical protein
MENGIGQERARGQESEARGQKPEFRKGGSIAHYPLLIENCRIAWY